MHAIAAWSSSRIQEERLALLVSVKNFIKLPDLHYLVHQKLSKLRNVPMGEEHPSSKKYMGSVASQGLESFEQLGIYPSRSKLVDQFIIINGLLLPVAGYRSVYIPRGDNLLLGGGTLISRCITLKIFSKSQGLRLGHTHREIRVIS